MSFLDSLFIFLQDNSIFLIISFLYLAALFLGRFIGNIGSFALVGYFLLNKIIPTTISISLFSFLSSFLIIFFSFQVGFLFPWQKVNLFKTKLYKSSISAYILIVLLFTAVMFFRDRFALPLAAEYLKGDVLPMLLPFLLLISGIRIKEILVKLKGQGPLSQLSFHTSSIFNLITFILIAIAVLFKNEISVQSILLICGKSIFVALLITVVLRLAEILTHIKYGEFKYLILLAALIIGFSTLSDLSQILMPLFAGLFLSLQKEGEQEKIINDQFIQILFNIIILFSAVVLSFSRSIFIFLLIYLLLRIVFYKLVFFTVGKLVNLNEDVYRNINKPLNLQGGLPLLFVFYGYDINILSNDHLVIFASVIMLAVVIENFIYGPLFMIALKKSGETN